MSWSDLLAGPAEAEGGRLAVRAGLGSQRHDLVHQRAARRRADGDASRRARRARRSSRCGSGAVPSRRRRGSGRSRRLGEVERLDVQVAGAGDEVGDAPGDAVVVAEPDAGRAGVAGAGNVVAGPREVDLVQPDRQHVRQVRVRGEHGAAGGRARWRDGPVVGAAGRVGATAGAGPDQSAVLGARRWQDRLVGGLGGQEVGAEVRAEVARGGLAGGEVLQPAGQLPEERPHQGDASRAGPSARGRTPGSRTRRAAARRHDADLVDPGVDAGREAVERLGLLGGEGGDLLVRQDAEPEQAVAAVRGDGGRPEDLGQPPERPPAVVVDLPEPILRQREAVPDEQVARCLGVDVGGAGGVADDPDGLLDVAAEACRLAGGSLAASRASRAASTAASGTPACRAASARVSFPRSTSSSSSRPTPLCPFAPLRPLLACHRLHLTCVWLVWRRGWQVGRAGILHATRPDRRCYVPLSSMHLDGSSATWHANTWSRQHDRFRCSPRDAGVCGGYPWSAFGSRAVAGHRLPETGDVDLVIETFPTLTPVRSAERWPGTPSIRRESTRTSSGTSRRCANCLNSMIDRRT